jgi:septal ring factor EnvC (AmiA/AmiB activator)
VAEEVEKVNPDLVARDAKGKPYTVRYEAVNAMLLNEFLKEHRKVADLERDLRATIAQQQKQINALTANLKEQAAQIQKVNDQVQLSKAAPPIVAGD